MKKNRKNQRAKKGLLSDDFVYIPEQEKERKRNMVLKTKKRSRESHGKYKPSSDSTT